MPDETDIAVGEIDEKFMFNMNVFHDEAPEEEDAPPPPPTFSEAELAAAKKAGFKDGHAQATQEQKDSQNQAIAHTLSHVTRELQTLFTAENQRATLYEQEAVHLTVHTLEAIMPLYTARFGFEELRGFLTQALDRQRSAKTISITVAPAMQEGVQQHVQSITAQHSDMHCEVIADESLSAQACRVAWADGGAFYDPAALSAKIVESLEASLREDGFVGHDKCGQDDAQAQTDAKKHDTLDSEDSNAPETAAQADESDDNSIIDKTEKAGETPATMEKPDE